MTCDYAQGFWVLAGVCILLAYAAYTNWRACNYAQKQLTDLRLQLRELEEAQ